jgi:hypothetical protein
MLWCTVLGIAQVLGIAEVVIDEHVGGLDAFLALDGEKSGITRAGADEVTDARGGCLGGHDGKRAGKVPRVRGIARTGMPTAE